MVKRAAMTAKRPSSSKQGDLRALAEALVAQPKQEANHLPRLLASLSSGEHEVAPVVHSLTLFFLDCFERGELDGRPPPAADTSPEAVYAAWLHRQYAAFITALVALIGGASTDVRAQVAAFAALLECVRGEQPGAFNNRLFHRGLEAALTCRGTSPEVVGLLLSKYMDYADVRYYTLHSVERVALAHAVRHASRLPGSGAAAGGGAEAASDDEDAGGEQQQQGAAAGARLSRHDLARTLFDLLVSVPASMEDEDVLAASWCGASEFGLVAPATDGMAARQRKRQRLEEQQEQQGEGQEVKTHAKWASRRLHRRACSDAWLAVLRIEFPEDIYKKLLARMHDLVIPALQNPLMVADFLMHCLDQGGLIGILALNGIFMLVTQHGLEYPNFFQRLYNLLTPEVFLSKYRARFFRLVDIFMASPMVPAYTGAAFAKRFARLALTASPAGALLCIAFIHNIVRRHPACMQLLHRARRAGAGAAPAEHPEEDGAGAAAAATPNSTASSSGGGHANGAGSPPQQQQPAKAHELTVHEGQDPFDPEEPDPAKTRALQSTLWELEALRHHYNPSVSAYCSILDKDLSDRKKSAEIDVIELLGGSYAALFKSEAERRLKTVPTAFYQQPPSRLFDANCAADFPGWEL